MKTIKLLSILFLVISCSNIKQVEKKNGVCFSAFKSKVIGNSMEPTLNSGSEVAILKDYYKCMPFKRGQIVAYRLAAHPVPIIKRLVALPGDTITIGKDREILVNGNIIKNPKGLTYRVGKRSKFWILKGRNSENKLKSNYFLVLSDNYALNYDSRKYGPIFKFQIIGRAQKIN